MKLFSRFSVLALTMLVAALVGTPNEGVMAGAATALVFAFAPYLRGFSVMIPGLSVADVGEQLEEITKKFADSVKEVKGKQDELSEYQRQLRDDISNGKKSAEDLVKKTDEGIVQVNELKTIVAKHEGRMQELTQQLEEKFSKIKKIEGDQPKSIGTQLIEHKGFERITDKDFRGNERFSLKAMYRVQAGGLNKEPRIEPLVSLERRQLTIRDLLPTIGIDTDSVKYAKQTVRTNAAAPVAEGTKKPYSQYEWASATANVKTLAHLAKLSRQALMNASRLQAEVDSEMRYGLDFVEEQQLLYGTGVGENILGLMPQATAFALPAGVTLPTGSTAIDRLRMAMLQNALAMAPADGVVLNPIDWTLMELLKDDENRYLFANPQGTASKTIWSLPVVDTVAMTQNEFLVGAFGYGAKLYDRLTTEVLISTENGTDFEDNLVTMRAEKMIALAVIRAYAFTKGELNDA